MTPQDIFQSHRMIFDWIEESCKRDYRYPASVQHHLKVIELLLIGFNPEDIL